MSPKQIETCPLWDAPAKYFDGFLGPQCIARDTYCDIETTENYRNCYRYKKITKALELGK